MTKKFHLFISYRVLQMKMYLNLALLLVLFLTGERSRTDVHIAEPYTVKTNQRVPHLVPKVRLQTPKKRSALRVWSGDRSGATWRRRWTRPPSSCTWLACSSPFWQFWSLYQVFKTSTPDAEKMTTNSNTQSQGSAFLWKCMKLWIDLEPYKIIHAPSFILNVVNSLCSTIPM